jgi:6-methylsalicylate decarboxylase
VTSAYDVHQHLWPETVLRELEGRTTAPRALWRGDGRWEITLEAEPAFEVDSRDHDPQLRVERLAGQGVDRALVALSSPVGADSLLSVVSAWNGAGELLPGELGWWAAVPNASVAGRAELAREALARGAAGVCLPAAELASPRPSGALLELLDVLERDSAPLFIHPGPAAGGPDAPAWWSPCTDYVAQQHAAWHGFHGGLRQEFPRLRVIFALLAGLAPLQAERTAARGGPARERALHDELCFYETSSYGARAVGAMATVVGIGQLVHGSDYPVAAARPDPVEEAFGEGFSDIVRRSSVARALGYTWVPA